jgi:hypothetical protein
MSESGNRNWFEIQIQIRKQKGGTKMVAVHARISDPFQTQ